MKSSKSSSNDPTHDQIAEEAYLIWKMEGGGDSIVHWRQAEERLRAAPLAGNGTNRRERGKRTKTGSRKRK